MDAEAGIGTQECGPAELRIEARATVAHAARLGSRGSIGMLVRTVARPHLECKMSVRAQANEPATGSDRSREHGAGQNQDAEKWRDTHSSMMHDGP